MSGLSFRKSRPDNWVSPRPQLDASRRKAIHGRIRPMEEPSVLERWLGLS